MSKKTINLLLGIIIVVLFIITVKGFMLLSPNEQEIVKNPVATTTNNIPDNLSISEELGG
ncbi:MAG: hypothetical protein NT041_01680 [Candidatus Vogelbacteria bacterium]|nr:hypothetical protein [Candidatus Vogelbacteria bacterium]